MEYSSIPINYFSLITIAPAIECAVRNECNNWEQLNQKITNILFGVIFITLVLLQWLDKLKEKFNPFCQDHCFPVKDYTYLDMNEVDGAVAHRDLFQYTTEKYVCQKCFNNEVARIEKVTSKKGWLTGIALWVGGICTGGM